MTAIKSQNRLFSIVIPTWNNLAFLKLCIQSIQRNSYYNHQIIVHVNDGSDGTLEWIKKAGIDYTHSEQNIGVCFAMNMMRTKVKTDYILFLNDDMYVLPFWDKVLYDEIEKLSDNYFFLSATSIQPHTQSASTILANYGDSIETFQEDKLLKEYSFSLPKPLIPEFTTGMTLTRIPIFLLMANFSGRIRTRISS